MFDKVRKFRFVRRVTYAFSGDVALGLILRHREVGGGEEGEKDSGGEADRERR